MNRRHFLSLLGLAPVGAVAGIAYRDTDWADIRSSWPRTGETRQVFTTHNVGQPDWYQTEHQIVFDGVEWQET